MNLPNRALYLGYLVALSACSNVAQTPSYRACERDQDCYSHERCATQAPSQGRCVSAQIPRRSSFAFSGITEQDEAHGGYQIPWEFKGCELDAFDLETGVARIDLGQKLVPIRLNQLTFNEPIEGLCAASCAPQAYCDANKGQCAFARHGTWQLRRASRLGLAPLELTLHRQRQSRKPGAPAPSFSLRWPCTQAPTWLQESAQGLGFELGTPAQTPSDRSMTLPAMHCDQPDAVMDEGGVEFDLSQQTQASLKVQVIPIQQDPQQAGEFDLSLAWDRRPAPLLTAQSREGIKVRTLDCTQDSDCTSTASFPGYCGPRGRCQLKLARQRAATLTDLTSYPQQTLIALGSDRPGATKMIATVRGHASEVADMQIPLTLADTKAFRVCVPHWTQDLQQPKISLRTVDGPIDWSSFAARPLLLGTKACNADTLGQKQAPSRCKTSLRPKLRLLASLNQQGLAHFEGNQCPLPNGALHPLSLSLPIRCDLHGQCSATARHSELAGPCYDLELTMERPAGDLFRSLHQVFPAALCKGQDSSPLTVENPWAPRPILRGRVHAAPDTSGPLRVRVMAERLHDASEHPLGPFFFHQDVVPEGPLRGQFALPVEPGRYVITALAHDPITKGMAPFQIVDLQDSAIGVDDPSTQLHLVTGPLVQIQVNAPKGSLHVRARPIDTGSWHDDPGIPDLNDPQTCFPLDRGCSIRMLSMPKGSQGKEIPVDYRSVLRWATRPGGQHECPPSSNARKEPA